MNTAPDFQLVYNFGIMHILIHYLFIFFVSGLFFVVPVSAGSGSVLINTHRTSEGKGKRVNYLHTLELRPLCPSHPCLCVRRWSRSAWFCVSVSQWWCCTASSSRAVCTGRCRRCHPSPCLSPWAEPPASDTERTGGTAAAHGWRPWCPGHAGERSARRRRLVQRNANCPASPGGPRLMLFKSRGMIGHWNAQNICRRQV